MLSKCIIVFLVKCPTAAEEEPTFDRQQRGACLNPGLILSLTRVFASMLTLNAADQQHSCPVLIRNVNIFSLFQLMVVFQPSDSNGLRALQRALQRNITVNQRTEVLQLFYKRWRFYKEKMEIKSKSI